MQVLGFPQDKIRVLYGGIELNLFTFTKRVLPVDDEIIILSVGRLVEKKGFDTLIKAFRKIHSKNPRTSLHIIGTGPNREKLLSLIEELDISHAVFLRDVMNSPQFAEELKKAHIFCLASQTAQDGDVEGIPNAIKEAMASGIPVVSTMHAGIPELIHTWNPAILFQNKTMKN
jgi:glycosyltransferase involved in cell wall biosynthesis